MRLRLDPWAVEYNTAYHAEAAGDGRADVDTSVEGPWRRLKPEHAETFWDDLYFLDGSRRIEARVLLEQDAGLCPGSDALTARRASLRGRRYS